MWDYSRLLNTIIWAELRCMAEAYEMVRERSGNMPRHVIVINTRFFYLYLSARRTHQPKMQCL